ADSTATSTALRGSREQGEHRDGENAALAAELLEALCEEQQLRGLSQNAQGRWVDERGAAQGSHRQGADGPRQLKEKELATLYNRTAFPWTLTQDSGGVRAARRGRSFPSARSGTG
ncbi:unnamed protein product, partial [Prorocentrum cordatum]